MAEESKSLIVGVPRETVPGEHRVSLIPASISPLLKAGLQVVVETGAGVAAGFPDAAYIAQGANILDSRAAVFEAADIIVQVRAAGANPDAGRADLPLFRHEQVLVGSLEPLVAPQWMVDLSEKTVISFALELLPRITRAQSMDILSSMSTIIGYKAVLLAAAALPRIFPMMMTAAGTVTPAKVLVIGAGVAGLQAIATARRLGASVSGYDLRPAVKQEVESLGAKFVELPLEATDTQQQGGYAKQMSEEFYRKQREVMAKCVAESDIVIATAVIPGKKAPVLITAEMVSKMTPGSVIVDLAAERGGNCELTRPNETIVEHGVTIIGAVNLAATVPYHASQMLAKNVTTFLLLLVKQGAIQIELEDEIIRDTLVTRDGAVVNPRVRELLGLAPVTPMEARAG